MNRLASGQNFGPGDRIVAVAEATEVYVETLEDPCLANVYWGLSLGLRLAWEILTAEDPATEGNPLRGPSIRGPRPADLVSPSASTRSIVSQASQGR
jgi:hypothetical protein